MITHQEIYDEVTSKELSSKEYEAVKYFEEILNKKVKSDFVVSNKMYVSVIIFEDYFRNNNIPFKRQEIILEHLTNIANDAGWNFKTVDTAADDYYYIITPKK